MTVSVSTDASVIGSMVECLAVFEGVVLSAEMNPVLCMSSVFSVIG